MGAKYLSGVDGGVLASLALQFACFDWTYSFASWDDGPARTGHSLGHHASLFQYGW